jgi:hypothetical protein
MYYWMPAAASKLNWAFQDSPNLALSRLLASSGASSYMIFLLVYNEYMEIIYANTR